MSDQSPEVVDCKDKKKKRRSRRSKHNSNISACSSVNEMSPEPESPDCLVTGSTSNCVKLNEQQLGKASYVAFNSLPIMHINGQVGLQEGVSGQNQQPFPSDYGGTMFSKSCPEPITGEISVRSHVKKDYFLPDKNEYHAQRKYFFPHWTTEAVNGALAKGTIYKALFRVNAHNRLEAYCKIDGVPSDVLISGIAAQNRAVEGDIVAIKVDPLTFWTKMKGSIETSNNPALMDDHTLLPGVTESVSDSCKGKSKVDAGYEYTNCRNDSLLLEKGFHYDNTIYPHENVNRELGPTGNGHVNGNYQNGPSRGGCFSEQTEVLTGLEKLCSIISSFPSKRPTGKVVAIIDKSPRRDSVIGFLSVREWVYNRSLGKDTKKNHLSLLSSNHEYILLTPTDPKFPKMMVPVRSLPDCIKKRLEDGDETVEMELVASQIVDWGEECSVPQALVIQIFGRGAEIEPQIAAILFENAIQTCDFSPETLSCLPLVPWEVPREEFQRRRDMRNFCIFTIDPATATDLDDALSVESLSNGLFRVGVHIADVSYFVLPDTHLDTEAQIRSTSVYLLRRKISMLPSLLSENIGSLNPGVDRLAFSIFWDINLAGEVLDRWIGRTIIRSCCKLSYENAQDIIDGLLENGGPQLHGNFEWSDVIRSVKSLHEISKTLKENRFNNGALSLENPKLVFLFDEDGIPCNSVLSGRKDSNFLVEEFMLLANRTAAEVITRAYPASALLRRHPEPNLRKLRELEAFCNKHGLELDTSSSAQIHHSLERIKKELKNDSVLFDILVSYATRPMQLAAYFCTGDTKESENKWSHYALAVPLYTHFTSPLRRYPDIVVHRILAATLEAEEMYLKKKRMNWEEMIRCFTGVRFDKDSVESTEAQESLSSASLKHKVPGTNVLADVAAYCNERKLASRHVKEAVDKLYLWVLLRRKEILFSEAKVLGLGPRFMSIYIHKLAIERRIYYDEVEGLTAEWLDTTSTLVLNLCTTTKRFPRRGSPGKWRGLEELALVINPCDLMSELDLFGDNDKEGSSPKIEGEVSKSGDSDIPVIEPAVFPLTVRLLSTIPVALHAVGGDDGPLDIGARLYISSYFQQG